jgi:hypothetical protein
MAIAEAMALLPDFLGIPTKLTLDLKPPLPSLA